MLILSRTVGQDVHFYLDGEYIGKVTVVDGGGRIRLGFDFGEEFAIVRKEADRSKADRGNTYRDRGTTDQPKKKERP